MLMIKAAACIFSNLLNNCQRSIVSNAFEASKKVTNTEAFRLL